MDFLCKLVEMQQNLASRLHYLKGEQNSSQLDCLSGICCLSTALSKMFEFQFDFYKCIMYIQRNNVIQNANQFSCFVKCIWKDLFEGKIFFAMDAVKYNQKQRDRTKSYVLPPCVSLPRNTDGLVENVLPEFVQGCEQNREKA